MIGIRPRPLLLGVVWAVLIVGGLVAYRTAHAATFSWFAYSPDPPTYVSSSTPTSQQIIGLVLAAVGLAGGSATVAYLIGHRAGGLRPRP